ncbi:hypothetical protein CIPAW_02G012400 [Carya illinoinensis]|uniref:Uncharacterized protein n=1 Tax=Carya illinoinensis TaxID=32201 RepID=A0A8T1R7Z2_CARIL|nr:hypothetical protein CIPAW_02G012400 [Carya illinoinensis]
MVKAVPVNTLSHCLLRAVSGEDWRERERERERGQLDRQKGVEFYNLSQPGKPFFLYVL